MPRSHSRIFLHAVFSTKNRAPMIPRELWPTLVATFRAELDRSGRQLLAAGGAEDHAHLLWRHSRDVAPAMAVRDAKRISSRWIKGRGEKLAEFYWQEGYGVFSVGASNVEEVRQYVLRQEAHHRSKSFDQEIDEFRRAYDLEEFDL